MYVPTHTHTRQTFFSFLPKMLSERARAQLCVYLRINRSWIRDTNLRPPTKWQLYYYYYTTLAILLLLAASSPPLPSPRPPPPALDAYLPPPLLQWCWLLLLLPSIQFIALETSWLTSEEISTQLRPQREREKRRPAAAAVTHNNKSASDKHSLVMLPLLLLLLILPLAGALTKALIYHQSLTWEEEERERGCNEICTQTHARLCSSDQQGTWKRGDLHLDISFSLLSSVCV